MASDDLGILMGVGSSDATGPTVTDDDITAAANAAGVDPNLYARLVHQESGGQINRVSHRGAIGPAQLMPDTASDLGVDPHDPKQNLLGGAKYLRQQLDTFKDPALAVAAYNAGPAAVARAGGVPPFPETQAYVKAVVGDPDLDTLLGAAEPAAPSPAAQGDAAEAAYQAFTHPKAAPETPAERPSGEAAPMTVYDPAAGVTRNPDGSVFAVGKLIGPAYQHNAVNAWVGEGDNDPGTVSAWLKAHPNDPANKIQPLPAEPLAGQSSVDRLGIGVGQGVANIGATADRAELWLRRNVPGVGLLEPNYDPAAAFSNDLVGRLRNDTQYGSSDAYGLGKFLGEAAPTIPVMMATDGLVGAIGSRALAAAPGLAPVADFVGGTAGGSNLLMRGASMAARGALQGGEAAALASGGSDAPLGQQIGTGMATGAVLGPVAGAVGAGVDAGSRLFRNSLVGTPEGIVSASEPELGASALDPQSASMKVANTLTRAFARDNITPAEAIAAARENPGIPAFHAGGPNVAGVTEVAAKSPGEAQNIIRSAIADHIDSVPGQIRADIGTAIGGQGDYLATLDRTIAARRDAARTGMDAIKDVPLSLSADSVQALRSDLAQPALKSAAANALASTDPLVREQGAQLNRIAAQVLDNPAAATITIRNAQDISRALLDAADSAYRGGDGARGAALKGLGRAIRQNASNRDLGGSPDYATWLKQYGDDSSNIDALNLGHGVFSSAKGNTAADVQKTLTALGPAAADYYRKGVAEALIDQTRSSQGGVGTMRQLLKNQELQDKVRLAFPDQASYDQFVASAERRVGEQNLNNRLMGGSPTYPLQAARQDLEAQPFHVMDAVPHVMDVGGNILMGNFAGLAGKGLKAAASKLPRADRSVIGDPTANALLGRALTDPDTLETLLSLPARAAWERANPKSAALLAQTGRANTAAPLGPNNSLMRFVTSNVPAAGAIGANMLMAPRP